MTDECRKKIIELAKQGMPDEHIAKIVHYAPMYIREIRQEARIFRKKPGNRKYSKEQIYEMITSGINKHEIAHTIGCSVSLVDHYRRKIRAEKDGMCVTE